MRLTFSLCLIVIITTTSCVSNIEVVTATPTLPLSSPTSSPSPVPTSTSTIVPTPQSTLMPDQAEEIIQSLLQESIDCEAPCFWGIIPGQTTLEDAKKVFSHLGGTLQFTNTLDNKDYFEFTHKFDYGLSTSSLLTIQNEIVKNLRVYITPEPQQPDIPRGWSSYSPETLIVRYSKPSKVEIVVDTGPRTFFALSIYFESFDLIIEYAGYGIISTDTKICPLTDQYDTVRIWLGENPEHPPGAAVPLEEATYLTTDEFANLMTGDIDKACFPLRIEAFP